MIGESPTSTGPADPTATPDPAPGDAGVERKGDRPTQPPAQPPSEWGGREGPDPVRYGDWEKNGRCIDF
ncbi:DUF1674 domain-containing protein [Lysobacter sp. A3-1-A15]|uniref:DUF1674 domain-containing protein n=1 Tax=Novilysobacter viscosus TaxID=3098602 RepID=UPI002EDA1392